MSTTLPERRVSKSKFAMYLRTLCDKELYLSLFSNNAKNLESAGIPVPLKSRPGVQLITKSGQDFEYEQYDILCTTLPKFVYQKGNGRVKVDLATALKAITAPCLILQPEFEPEKFRDFALSNLGVVAEDQQHIPELSDLRPDIVFAYARSKFDHEILPDGSRKALADNDNRTALSVIDLKNITEANASYSAEVCLYAIFLSNWLHSVGKELLGKYFVTDKIQLWRHVEMPTYMKTVSSKDGGDDIKKLAALRRDLADGAIDYLVYMPSVRRFFSEVLPNVVRQGDLEGWATLEYHVNPRCNSCDWLGNRAWLKAEDKKLFESHPSHYCTPAALSVDHLSQMANVSKGASSVLTKAGHSKVADVTKIAPSARVLKEHALLKRDRTQIAARATSVTSGGVTVDQKSRVGGLAKRLGSEYDIIVNFDAGTGFLTGIGLRGSLFSPYGQKFTEGDGTQRSIHPLGEAAFVVNKDNMQAEWAALSSFIDRFAAWLNESESTFAKLGFGKVRTQICFWEVRQYEELCNAFSRHLLDVLELPDRYQKALAWVFPPDELIEKSDSICPNIIFIKDIAVGSVHLPQRFANTLLGTAADYHHPKMTPRTLDNYYVEPLGNGVPRERIFEIWKTTTGAIRMFGRTISVADAVELYGRALKAHCWALASITARLRTDLKNVISGDAPELSLTIPQGLRGVAYDSKLWDRWSLVSAAVSKTESLASFLTKAEWLEASYKAVVLVQLRQDFGAFRYEFEVSDDSTEAKIEQGDICTVGILNHPGFPLERPSSLGLSVEPSKTFVPMHKVVAVDVEKFDRVNRTIVIKLRPTWGGMDAVFQELMKSGSIPIGKSPIFLLQGMPYDDSDTTTELLSAIGDPSCGVVAPEAIRAMGHPAAKKITSGKGADFPAAKVLWQGDKLAATKVRNGADAQALATAAMKANTRPLNESQQRAVKHCAEHQLSIIWGPPGTGKTDTLVAYLQATVLEGRQKKILITGPNYRTVEELAGRLVSALERNAAAASGFFWLYSKSHGAKPIASGASHLVLKSAILDDTNAEFAELKAHYNKVDAVTIIATTAHMLPRLAKSIGPSGSALSEVFDLVVLDESSQVPITLALKPLATLRPSAQLIVAGDHKQMPPIQKLEPPKDAEYLVGSIQSYLITRFKLPTQTLLINYRSNQDLVDFAKSLDYPAELKAASTKKDIRIVRAIGDVAKELPASLPQSSAYLELLPPERRVTALIHDDPVSSQANEVEAGLVAGLAFMLRHAAAANLDTGSGDADIAQTDGEFFRTGLGIVTPHKAQKALVLRKLIELFPKADPAEIFDAVDTVERFQGGERNAIIVSFGVGDTDIIEGEEEFLLQLERTNVAVSRAKAKCIVLMPKSLAYHLPSEQKAAATSVAIKSYLEEFCAHRKGVEISYAGTVRSAEARWH